jgi:hypothetical protein
MQFTNLWEMMRRAGGQYCLQGFDFRHRDKIALAQMNNQALNASPTSLEVELNPGKPEFSTFYYLHNPYLQSFSLSLFRRSVAGSEG